MVDVKKEWLNPSREKIKASTANGRWRNLLWPSSCVTPTGTPTNLTSRINGMATTHTPHTYTTQYSCTLSDGKGNCGDNGNVGGHSKLGTNATYLIRSIPTNIHEIFSYLDI